MSANSKSTKMAVRTNDDVPKKRNPTASLIGRLGSSTFERRL
jgi:hypothetical protein